MRLSLRTKVMVVPLILMLVSSIFLIGMSLWVENYLWQEKVNELSVSQAALAKKSLDSIKTQALTIAAMAAAIPGVQKAYEMARNGQEAEGRAFLRQNMGPIHQSVTSTLGIKFFKIHFHLPPAKSFLRIWRKAGKNDGGDDLSSFRKTVLDVNKWNKPVTGIEIGRGGFAIRGLVPINSPRGIHLGSVECLFDFNKIFKTARLLNTDNVAVYMLAKELEIARKLKKKNLPQIAGLVRIFSSNTKATDPFIKKSLLSKSLKGKTSIQLNGHLLTGLPIKDFSGSTQGVLIFVRDAARPLAIITKIRLGLIIGGSILLILLCFFLYISSSSIVNNLNKIIGKLEKSSGSIANASNEISSSSQTVANGASEQAASLEETSASMEETTSTIKVNADNAQQADQLMRQAKEVTNTASNSMQELVLSMADISQASEETSKIIKSIDEVAFQTNLLALNAAVEAARAGEAGAGFAVVADEVRDLALRSTKAAKNTARLIEITIDKVKNGEKTANSSTDAFNKVANSTNKVSELVNEISIASQEQAHGVEQINHTLAEMENVTQANAASAEESAAASEEMRFQATQLEDIVDSLKNIITGIEGSDS